MALSIHPQAHQVIFEEVLGARKVILNDPKKLNALGYEMIRKMYGKLSIYEIDPTVKLVILKAYGKLFCVGGDLMSTWKVIAIGHWSFVAAYYRKAFSLDYLLATYKKPVAAILDGGVMGGGIFAMPEASIGLFPDVGASYFLLRLPGFFGEYIGLTGSRLDGAEMLAFGLGTHFVPSQKLQSMEKALENLVASSDAASVATMSMIINKFAEKVNVKPDSVIARLDLINQCFCGESCEEILSSLECFAMQVKEKWIRNSITSMKSASPIALKIFLTTIRKGRSQNIKQCLETEYIAISHFLRGTVSNDFCEVAS